MHIILSRMLKRANKEDGYKPKPSLLNLSLESYSLENLFAETNAEESNPKHK